MSCKIILLPLPGCDKTNIRVQSIIDIFFSSFPFFLARESISKVIRYMVQLNLTVVYLRQHIDLELRMFQKTCLKFIENIYCHILHLMHTQKY